MQEPLIWAAGTVAVIGLVFLTGFPVARAGCRRLVEQLTTGDPTGLGLTVRGRIRPWQLIGAAASLVGATGGRPVSIDVRYARLRAGVRKLVLLAVPYARSTTAPRITIVERERIDATAGTVQVNPEIRVLLRQAGTPLDSQAAISTYEHWREGASFEAAWSSGVLSFVHADGDHVRFTIDLAAVDILTPQTGMTGAEVIRRYAEAAAALAERLESV